MLQYKWENLTAGEFDESIEKSGGLCVMPMGCMERHGEHLAVGCDSLKAHFIADAAAEKEYAVVFPTGLWVGDVFGIHALSGQELEHPYKKRGYIAPSPELLYKVMKELCFEIHRNGFRKILVLNSHGGNSAFLNNFIRAMSYDKHDFAVMWTNAQNAQPDKVYEAILKDPDGYPALTDEEMATLKHFAETGTGGGHGDIRETALCMGGNPELVRPDKYEACPGQSTHKADYLTELEVFHGQSWATNFPFALGGYPSTGCTENIGKAFIEFAARRVARIYKGLKEDENCVKMAKRESF